jgi:hypothetical protein
MMTFAPYVLLNITLQVLNLPSSASLFSVD